MQEGVDVGAGLNLIIVVLAALGFNVATIIGGAIAVASRLTRIEAAQTAAKEAATLQATHAKETGRLALGQLEKELGKLEQRVDTAESDIDAIGDCCRDVKTAVDQVLELKRIT